MMITRMLTPLCFLLCCNLQAQSLKPVQNTTNVKAAITRSAAAVTSLQADFEQVKEMPQLLEPISSSGRFMFQRPASIRWEYTAPSQYVIVMNNGKMLVTNAGKTRRFDTAKNKVFAEMNRLMLSFVKGDVFQEEKFSNTIFENQTEYVVKLMPLQPPLRDMLAGGIEMVFDKKDYAVLRVRMVQSADNFTMLRFKNQRLNHRLDDAQFSVK